MIKKIELYLITNEGFFENNYNWVDITQYVEQGFSINDSCDGTLDNGKLVFTVEENISLGLLDVSKPIPPRIKLRIREYQTFLDPGGSASIYYDGSSYIFMTSDTNSAPLRTKQIDDKGNVKFLYTHEVNYVELTKELEGKYPPNFSVRQPKNIYNRIYTRSTGWDFTLGDSSTQYYADGSAKSLTYSNVTNDKPDLNNESGAIAIGSTSNPSIRFNTIYDGNNNPIAGVAFEDYTLTFFLTARMACPQIIVSKYLGIDDDRFCYPVRSNGISTLFHGQFCYDNTPISINCEISYYNSSGTRIEYKYITKTVNWRGDSKKREVNLPAFGTPELGPIEANQPTTVASLIIASNRQAKYAIVNFTYQIEELIMCNDTWGPGYGGHKNKEIRGLDLEYGPSIEQIYAKGGSGANRSRMPFYMSKFNVSIGSSVIQEFQLDSSRTLYDIANKALQEINLRQRTKYSFSQKLTGLLQQKSAPEFTLQDYNFRELLSKFCRILEVLPILGDSDVLEDFEKNYADTIISYIKPGENFLSYDIDTLGEDTGYTSTEKSQTLDEFYDIISSRLYNCISEEDYHTEQSIFQAADADFAQITSENAGFVTSYPIYWLREIKVKFKDKSGNLVGIPFSYTDEDGAIVNATMYGNNPDFVPTSSTHQSWNMTDRCFEEDIYNALPDVNFITKEARMRGEYSKANTISYKSGTTFIKNLCHLGPAVPDFDISASGVNVAANLAILETAIVLAYIQYGGGADYPNFKIADTLASTYNLTRLLNTEAEITYTALNEFTYRNSSLQTHKLGRRIEHRVNTQDRVSSYKDAAYYIRAEQNKKGNIVASPTLIYPNITSCLPTGLKLNEDYVITSRKLKVFEEYVECSYELAQHFVLQSDDVKLDIEFERYAIPYDYIQREVLVFCHALLGYDYEKLYYRYGYDVGYDGLNSPTDGRPYLDMLFGFISAPKQTIGRCQIKYYKKIDGTEIQSERFPLVRLHLLLNDNQVTYIGKFVDNYSAGNQVFHEGDWNYAEPFRYCDSLGKTRKFKISMYDSLTYPLKKFPDGESVTAYGKLLVSTSLNEEEYGVGDDKDSREAYEFNITGSVESTIPDILVFSVGKRITDVGILDNAPNSLSTETTLNDLKIIAKHKTSGMPHATLYSNSMIRYEGDINPGVEFEIRLEASIISEDIIGKPLVCWTEDRDGNATLMYIFRNYTWETTTVAGRPSLYIVKIYMITTRQGQHEKY